MPTVTEALPNATLVSETDIGKATGFDSRGAGCGIADGEGFNAVIIAVPVTTSAAGMITVNCAQTPTAPSATSHKLAVVVRVAAPLGPSNSTVEAGVKLPSEKPDPVRVSVRSVFAGGAALGGLTT